MFRERKYWKIKERKEFFVLNPLGFSISLIFRDTVGCLMLDVDFCVVKRSEKEGKNNLAQVFASYGTFSLFPTYFTDKCLPLL